MIEDLELNVAGWTIIIFDNGVDGRNKENHNKYNWEKTSRECVYNGCQNTHRKRMSGLCDEHKKHQHDIFLQLINSTGDIVTAPKHGNIIDDLLSWSKPRNYALDDFFAEISFHVQGNIPDVSTLANAIEYPNGTPDIELETLQDIYDFLLPVIEKYFPENNSSSYQKLSGTGLPVLVLVNIFVGLLICEESNRGDRWCCRNHLKDESRTTQLGAAMSLSYYAVRTFPWGVEIKSIYSLFSR